MKKWTLVVLLWNIVASCFAQSIINKTVHVYNIKHPLIYKNDVQTTNGVWQNNEFKKSFNSIDREMGYSPKIGKGLMAISGLTYNITNPDITLTLNRYAADSLHSEIINISNNSNTLNFRIVYTVPIRCSLEISGKYTE